MRTAFVVPFLSLLLAGCGGGISLKYTIEGSFLGDLGPEEKGTVFEAMANVNKAQDEVWRAEHAKLASERELGMADSKIDRAKVGLDRAKVERDYAVQTKDISKVEPAEKGLADAKLSVQVAQAERTLSKARLAYAEAAIGTAKKQVVEAVTRVELARAQLVVAKNKRPTEDFDLAAFERQTTEAQRSWNETKVEADRLQLEVSRAESVLADLRAKLDGTK